MAGWESLHDLVRREVIQLGEEGYDVSGWAEQVVAAGDDQPALMALYAVLQELPSPPTEVDEPSHLEGPGGIREVRGTPSGEVMALTETLEQQLVQQSDARWDDAFLGAWLGRCCGCALGKPLECGPFMGTAYTTPQGATHAAGEIPGWLNVQRWFAGADAWPIMGYTPEHSRAEQEFGLALSPWTSASVRERIHFMETDDDIRYTVLGLLLMETRGENFDAFDVGKHWHAYLPYNAVCTAETQAYLNFGQVTYHTADNSLRPDDWAAQHEWVRSHLNPYREWIGAQIRADPYAYAAAGDPALAAEWAGRDASFSHIKNGIYGSMYVAALIAAAFVLPTTGDATDAEQLIVLGLAQIPPRSRLSAAIRRAIDIARAAVARDPHGDHPEEMVAKIWEAFCHYDPVHTINNAALVTAALYFACATTADPSIRYERGITTAVLGGWDTDCNGATTGSILGALVGAAALPTRWTAPLHDTLYAGLADFHPIALSALAKRSQHLWRHLHANPL